MRKFHRNEPFLALFPLVEKLYDLDYIDLSIEGDFEDFIKNHNEYSSRSSNYQFQTLTAIYSSPDFYEESEPKKELRQNSMQEPKVIQMPVSRVKVNRNDPCPCGSGKKYKKCCG